MKTYAEVIEYLSFRESVKGGLASELRAKYGIKRMDAINSIERAIRQKLKEEYCPGKVVQVSYSSAEIREDVQGIITFVEDWLLTEGLFVDVSFLAENSSIEFFISDRPQEA